MSLRCTNCGGAFRFLGLPPAVVHDMPGTDEDGFVLRVPVVPRYGPMTGTAEMILATGMAFDVIGGLINELPATERLGLFDQLRAAYCMNCGRTRPEHGACLCTGGGVD